MKTRPPELDVERLPALLALAACREQPPEACPDAESLAALAEQSLRGNARRRLLAHLNRCPDCYAHWLEVATILAENAPLPRSIPANMLGRLHGLWQGLRAATRHWPILVPAAAAVVLAIALWPTPTTVDARLDAGYAAMVERPPAELMHALRRFPLPHEAAALGFAPAAVGPAGRAVRAGLWVGLETLQATDGEEPPTLPKRLQPPPGGPWSQSVWSDYYDLGRWLVLLWTQAATDASVSDWQRQLATLEALRDRFEQRTVEGGGSVEGEQSAVVTGLLREVESLMHRVQRDGALAQRRLTRRLEMMSQQMVQMR